IVAHLYRLGFVINRQKSVLCPRQVTHFLGMVLDSTSMEVRLSQQRINAIKTCVHQFRLGQSVPSLPTSVGHDGISRDRSTAGDVAHAAFPNVVSVSETQRSQRQITQNNGVLQMQESPGNLENPLV